MEKMPSFDSHPEKKESSVGKWLKRSVALAGATAVGYMGALKKEKSAHEVVSFSEKPKAVETIQPTHEGDTNTGTNGEVKTHVEMRHVKIAYGIEQEHAIEVDDKGNQIRDLGVYHLWKEVEALEKSKSSFQGYGTETQLERGEVTKTPYGSKSGAKTTFSGYGITTETDKGEATKTPYGESKNGKKKFRGYGIEQ